MRLSEALRPSMRRLSDLWDLILEGKESTIFFYHFDP